MKYQRRRESLYIVLHQLLFNYGSRGRTKLLVSFIDCGALH